MRQFDGASEYREEAGPLSAESSTPTIRPLLYIEQSADFVIKVHSPQAAQPLITRKGV